MAAKKKVTKQVATREEREERADVFAQALMVVHRSFLKAGFNSDEAFELTKMVLAKDAQ